MNRLGIILLLVCGLMLADEANGASSAEPVTASVCGVCGKAIYGDYISYKNGAVYHRRCHESARRCSICGLPIGKDQPVKTDAAGNAFHGACYENALFCVACGQPVIAGQSYRKSGKDNTIWHKGCFANARFCAITGSYIKPGVPTVRIGSEIFIKTEYDKVPKCLVSALPLINHGPHIVNRRSNSYVLEKYKAHTRQCYSCGDWLTDGYTLKDRFFLCDYCYRNSVKTRAQADRPLENARRFFQENGLRLPKNIEIVILPPGQPVKGQANMDIKGACETEARFVGNLAFYTHTVEILYGLNHDRFAATLVHELSHAVIAEQIKYRNHREQAVSYEEGRCEYMAYRFAGEKGLPGYIVDGFALNAVAEYREGFLHFAGQKPENLQSVLTGK